MTIAPALQALIDEWRQLWATGDRTAKQCVLALEMTLQAHPVVPLSELRSALDCTTRPPREALEVLCFRYTPQPPNPHPQGTYLWAREEQLRGRTVRRPHWSNLTECAMWESMRFSHADFIATDWEVVK